MGIAQFPAAASGVTQSQVSDVVNWIQIGTSTTGGSSTITFSSIATGYKRFRLIMSNLAGTNGNQGPAQIRFNNDSANNYATGCIRSGYGSTTSIESYVLPNMSAVRLQVNTTGTTTDHTSLIIDVLGNNDASANTKYVIWGGSISENRSSTNVAGYYSNNLNSGFWFNTAEINRIDLTNTPDTWFFGTGGRVTLYGAK